VCATGNIVIEEIIDNSVDSTGFNEVQQQSVPDIMQFLAADLNNNQSEVFPKADSDVDIDDVADTRSDCDSDYVPSKSEESSDSDRDSDDEREIAFSPVAASPDVEEESSSVSKITVTMTDNTEHGRKYDKRAYCYFCGLSQSKLPRHLRNKHGTESLVANWLSETDEHKKELHLLKLRNLGNHSHNVQVIDRGEGEFVVTHRPKQESDYRKYVHCRFCYAYLVKGAIWKHSCPLAPKAKDGAKLRKLRKAGSDLAKNLPGETTVAFAGLLNGMRQDETGQLASKDSLILQLGQRLCSKFGGNSEQFHYIRSKMRHLANLLLALRKKSSEMNASMSDFIVPTKFRMVLDAAKECAGLNESASEYAAPSAAMKSGGILRRLTEIKQANALERGDTETAELCCQFMKLCDVNWSTEVSSVASRNLTDRKRSGVLYMPLTEDVVALNEFLVSEARRLLPTVTSSSESYASMTQTVMAKIIIFNRKRQGEVSKVTLQDYMKKGKADSSDVELALTDFERALLKTLVRMEIKGKRGRTVPILLTEEMLSWTDRLIEARSAFVPASNEYLFASLGPKSHFRGSDALRKFALLCHAKKPHLLTSTKLRKNVASMAQVLSLKEHELENLASFMGHDIRIHAQFYRMPLDVVQIARVSKIFLAAEQGRIAEFAGKELADISLDDAVVEGESGSETDVNEVDECESSASDATADNIPEVGSSESTQTLKRNRTIGSRKPWSEVEKNAVRSHFASYILQNKLPGKTAIEEFLKKSGIDRPWTKIKDYIRNSYLH
jgi:hypothetical protein